MYEKNILKIKSYSDEKIDTCIDKYSFRNYTLQIKTIYNTDILMQYETKPNKNVIKGINIIKCYYYFTSLNLLLK